MSNIKEKTPEIKPKRVGVSLSKQDYDEFQAFRYSKGMSDMTLDEYYLYLMKKGIEFLKQ